MFIIRKGFCFLNRNYIKHSINYLVKKSDFKDKSFQDHWRLKLFLHLDNVTSFYNKSFKSVLKNTILECRPPPIHSSVFMTQLTENKFWIPKNRSNIAYDVIDGLCRHITYYVIFFDVVIMWLRVNDVIGKYRSNEVHH